MRKILVLILLAPPLASCTPTLEAYWHKPTKYKELPAYKHPPETPVATLSLDATRRLVISQHDPVTGRRYTCPEPPPDAALSSLSQTLAALKTKGVEASVSANYETLVLALHARTSSVEFWRTSSSMYCVLLMNGLPVQAEQYLAAAQATIGVTKDTVAALPASGDFTKKLIDAALAQAADDADKAKAAQGKLRQDKLKAAQDKCAKLADDKKKEDADCAVVAAETDREAAEKMLKAAGI